MPTTAKSKSPEENYEDVTIEYKELPDDEILVIARRKGHEPVETILQVIPTE